MILKLINGLFMVLHGLVHFLYVGQSRRLFELQPGMTWPEGSWAFSRLFGNGTTRLLASVCYALAGAGFVAAGVGVLVGQPWWRPTIVSSATFSSAAIIIFWNGKLQKLPDQGLVALLINAAILVAVLILNWPSWVF